MNSRPARIILPPGRTHDKCGPAMRAHALPSSPLMHSSSITEEAAPISISPPTAPFGRMDAIDAARVLATFGIIWTHVAEGQGQTSEVATLGRFGTSFYIIAAALFAVQSSMRAPNRPFLVELKRKAHRLLWPFVLWSLIYGCYYGYLGYRENATWEGLTFWWGPAAGTAVHLWFLPFVFFWSLLASRLVPLLLKRSALTIFIFGTAIAVLVYWYCYTSLFFSVDRPWLWSWHLHRLDRWIVEVPPFVTAVVGALAYYRLKEERRSLIARHLKTIAICGALSFIAIQSLYLLQLKEIREATLSEGRFMANLAGLAILCTFLALARTSLVQRLAPLGRYTYLAFLCHMLIIELLRRPLQSVPGYGSVTFSLLASVLVLAGSLLVSYTIRKTPALKWLRP